MQPARCLSSKKSNNSVAPRRSGDRPNLSRTGLRAGFLTPAVDRAARRAYRSKSGRSPSRVASLSMPPDGLRDVHNGTRIGEDETAMLTTQRHDRRVRRQAGLLLESLDDRLLLSGGARGATAEALVHHQPANHAHRYDHISLHEVLRDRSPAALPGNFSAALRSLYREYEDQVRDSRSTPALPGDGVARIGSVRVAVRIKVAFPPALGAYLRDLRADGLQVIRTVPAYGLAEGMCRSPSCRP